MKQFKKIDIYYRKSNGEIIYLSSTTSFKLVRDAIDNMKFILKNPAYKKVEEKRIGEQINVNKLFGRIDKSDL